VAEVARLLSAGVPTMVQGCCRAGAGLLAERLCGFVGGDYVTIFTNTGAETVEAALKHAHLETGKHLFWTVSGAFHGKTTGAVQLTASYRDQFVGCGPETQVLDQERPEQWEELKAETGDRLAGIFVEPIQGEGGVRALSADFVEWLNRVSSELGVPLVVDEIQSGMGRTGTFLASTRIGLRPDYICLAKSLGGGILKIGALMIRRERFDDRFAILHTSTFAEDDLTCRVALKALQLHTDDDLVGRCDRRGRWLKTQLEGIQERFPAQIREVRGSGLMLGVEFADLGRSPSRTFRGLDASGMLQWMATAYMLHVHDVRVAPTLSRPRTLRIQPSAYVTESDLRPLLTALECFCEALRANDAAHLLGHQVGRPSIAVSVPAGVPVKNDDPANERRVAFVGHPLTPDDMFLADHALRAFDSGELSDLLDRTSSLGGPFVADRINVGSATGDSVHLTFIGLLVTAQLIARTRRSRKLGWIREQIDDAVLLAKAEGCQIVGLGGYTSSVTGNCRRVRTNGIALTSGNSLTVGCAVDALRRAAGEHGIARPARIGILGVPGNIAGICATLLAEDAAELILVARRRNTTRLRAIVDRVRSGNPEVPITVSDDLAALRGCSLILCASVAGGGLLLPEHVGSGPVVICDVSRPPDVTEEVLAQRPEAIVLDGGIVRLPRNDDFTVPGIPLPRGRSFACMAETLLMGLSGVTGHGSYGDISPEQVTAALSSAARHGFATEVVYRTRSAAPATP